VINTSAHSIYMVKPRQLYSGKVRQGNTMLDNLLDMTLIFSASEAVLKLVTHCILV